MATNKVVDNDALLARGSVFETNDDHAVALWTFAPAIGTVLFPDLAEFDEVQIAVCADVVVAGGGGGGCGMACVLVG